MALGTSMALLLRAKGGTNFLTQTQGVNMRDANEATRELMATLETHRKRMGTAETHRAGNSAPGFAAGQLLVCQDRFLAVYRLVNAVWVITVTPASANVLFCSHVITATIRLLIAASKGTDVTPDKLARSYPEVYLAIGHLLSLGGLSASINTLLTVAASELMTISPEAAKSSAGKLLPTANQVLSKFSLHKKSLQPSISTPSFSTSRDTDASTSRSRNEEPDYLSSSAFVLPQEVFASKSPAAPVGDLGITGAGVQHRTSPATTLDDLFGPAIPVPGSEFLAGTGLETLEAPAMDYGTKFSNLRPPPPPPISDNPWADFDSGASPIPAQGAEQQAQEPPKPRLPPPTAKQRRTIANGNAVQLVEAWKAAFVGPRLDMAGTFGEVLATGLVGRCEAETSMQLDYNANTDSGSAIASAVVQGAKGEQGMTRSVEGVCVALLSRTENGEEPFLRYKLPALAAMPPLLMAVTVTDKPKPRDPQKPSALQRQLSSNQEVEETPANGLPEPDSEPQPTEGSLSHGSGQALANGHTSVAPLDSGEKEMSSTGEEATTLSNGIQVEFQAGDVDLGNVRETSSDQAVASTIGQSSPGTPQNTGAAQEGIEGDGEGQSLQPEAASQVAVEFSPAAAELPQPPESATNLDAQAPADETASTTSPLAPVEMQGLSDQSETGIQGANSHKASAPEPTGNAKQAEQKLRLITVHLAVSPSLGGPLRGVCIDLDVSHQLGDIVGVVPEAKWASKQRRLRWELYKLDAGSRLRLRVLTRPIIADLSETRNLVVASLHAFGPPGVTLSGISLSSGTVSSELKPSRSAFHCEVIAQPEIAKQRGALSKEEKIDQAIRQYQAQRQVALQDGSIHDPDAEQFPSNDLL